MISVEQAEEIIKRTGLSTPKISRKMGKSNKYLLIQIAIYRKKKLPFSPHLAMLFFKAVGKKNYNGIVSDKLYKFCQIDYFLNQKQFEKFLKLLNCSHPMLAESIGMDSKVFYMAFRNRGGISFKTALKLFESYPHQMSKVLSPLQLELIFSYL